MRKIIVSEFVTLDGVMEDPGGSEKFKYGGWSWPYWSEEIGNIVRSLVCCKDNQQQLPHYPAG
jgi:hypothetical protein